jgi:hypothetical protein
MGVSSVIFKKNKASRGSGPENASLGGWGLGSNWDQVEALLFLVQKEGNWRVSTIIAQGWGSFCPCFEGFRWCWVFYCHGEAVISLRGSTKSRTIRTLLIGVNNLTAKKKNWIGC